MIRNFIQPIRLITNQSKILNFSNLSNLTWASNSLSQSQKQQVVHNQIKFNFSNEKKTESFKKKMTKQEMFKAQEEQLMKQIPDEDPGAYEKSSGYSGKIFMGLGVVGLMSIVGYAQHHKNNKQTDIDESISGMEKLKQEKRVKIGGQWTLIDHKNQSFSSSDLSGTYYLIYFGFTKCPDICPATLIKLGRALKLIRKMPEYHYMNLKCVFVSCDPDRDTPKRMKKYLKNFDEQIIGVTGTSNEDPQLKNCMKSFKIYSNKIPMQNGNYSMDHTTITYLMDDENNYVDHLNPNLSEQQMAKAIVNRLLAHDFKKMKQRNQKPQNRIS